MLDRVGGQSMNFPWNVPIYAIGRPEVNAMSEVSRARVMTEPGMTRASRQNFDQSCPASANPG
jgi:hypothetical protein